MISSVTLSGTGRWFRSGGCSPRASERRISSAGSPVTNSASFSNRPMSWVPGKWRCEFVETVDECEFCIADICLPLSVAIGVGMIERGDSPEAVLARADKEMYRIKAVSSASLLQR